MEDLKILSAHDVRLALPMKAAIDAMRETFSLLSAGDVDLPLRTNVTIPSQDGCMLSMPARAGRVIGVKVVSVFPRNPSRGRPRVNATLLLLDPETGEPMALLDGEAITALRTGAATGLATGLLARQDAKRVAIIGSGVQARTQLEGVCAVRWVDSAVVYSPTRKHAEQYAQEMAKVEGLPNRIDVADSAAEAAGDADIICTATSSAEPVLGDADVPDGAHVNAIGSFTPEMREIDPALLGRARVIVDQRQAAMAEAGEVIAAVEGGRLTEEDLVELGDVVQGRVPGRESESQVTVFKSVGIGVQDVVAAARALR